MFRDAIRILVGHLEDAGVDTVAIEAPGMFHVFPILMPWAHEAHEVGREVCQFVMRIVAAIQPRDHA
jgi:hypothetical protein